MAARKLNWKLYNQSEKQSFYLNWQYHVAAILEFNEMAAMKKISQYLGCWLV